MEADFLGRLVDEHGPALTLYARQWTDAPEDIVQEAFLKLIAQSKPPTQPVPWLYKVVRNAALDAARARQRRLRHESFAASAVPSWFVASEGEGLDAEAATLALEGLPFEQREVIVAHLWGGLPFEQIAELTGASSSTAHRWYIAGLTALRERLKVPCPNHPNTNRR